MSNRVNRTNAVIIAALSLAIAPIGGRAASAQVGVTATSDAATQPSADPTADQLEQLKLAIKENRFDDALALMDTLEPVLPEPDFYVASNRFRVLIKSKQYVERTGLDYYGYKGRRRTRLDCR
jgi:hypothetical protein